MPLAWFRLSWPKSGCENVAKSKYADPTRCRCGQNKYWLTQCAPDEDYSSMHIALPTLFADEPMTSSLSLKLSGDQRQSFIHPSHENKNNNETLSRNACQSSTFAVHASNVFDIFIETKHWLPLGLGRTWSDGHCSVCVCVCYALMKTERMKIQSQNAAKFLLFFFFSRLFVSPDERKLW